MEWAQVRNAEEEIRHGAEIMKSKLPVVIDEMTTLTDMHYDATSKKVVSDYLIRDLEKYSHEEITQITENWKRIKIGQAQQDPNNRGFVLTGTSMEFNLKDGTGKTYTSFLVTPQDMK